MSSSEFYDLATPLPPHHVVFNAIGDADLAATALAAAQSLLASYSNAPVINAPAAVAATGRSDTAQRLAGIAGIDHARGSDAAARAPVGSGCNGDARRATASSFRF